MNKKSKYFFLIISGFFLFFVLGLSITWLTIYFGFRDHGAKTFSALRVLIRPEQRDQVDQSFRFLLQGDQKRAAEEMDKVNQAVNAGK